MTAEPPVPAPNVARMYDFFLGGKDNYAVDRAAAEKVLADFPEVKTLARANRAFLGRAVRHVAGPLGVRQFIDIGSGLPTRESVHEVAAEAAPDASVVYADNDPVVVAQSRALLAGSNPRVAAIEADMRRPETVLDHPETTALIDFDRPVAILLLAVLHFLPDSDDPEAIVARYRERLAPGSCLVISYLGTGDSEEWNSKVAVSSRVYRNASAQYFPRTRGQVLRYFDGFELVEPGLATVADWQAGPPDAETWRAVEFAFAGVGRKP